MTDTNQVPDFVAHVEDAEAVRAVNIFSRNDVTVQVPLKFNDVIVGKAKVLPNGNIECDFNHSRLGLRLRDLMVEGTLDFLHLDHNMQPAEQLESD